MKKLLVILAAAGGLAASTFAEIVDLSQAIDDVWLEDGDIATGELAGNCRLEVGYGATVTLREVTIRGENDYLRSPGIICRTWSPMRPV